MIKLYVGNLSWGASNADLARLFLPFGNLNSVEVRIDRVTGRSRGYGFVEFHDADSAHAAVADLHGRDLDGRPIRVNVAVLREEGVPRPRFPASRFGPPVDNRQYFPPPAIDPPPLAEFLCSRPIIEVSRSFSLELMKYVQEHPEDLRRIDRRRFEELVAELWKGFGYDVELTQQTRDGGVDIIAVKHSIVAERYLIECKRPDPGKAIGVRPVRELYGVLTDQRATKGILATTAHFSPDAIIFIESNKWQLEGKDFTGLMDWIKHYIHRSDQR